VIILRRLFVGSIILLLSTTPLLVIAGVNEDIHLSTLNLPEENSLGMLIVEHLPMYRMIVRYYPPEEGNVYYFPEGENGYVNMNFTLNVSHCLKGGPFFASWIWPDNYRYTAIETWVNYDKEDYVVDKNIILCNSYLFKDYQIKMSAAKPLYTNGETLACRLWITAYPAITPIPFVQDILGLFLIQEVVVADIDINPIPDYVISN
jgi:hypothetical protein